MIATDEGPAPASPPACRLPCVPPATRPPTRPATRTRQNAPQPHGGGAEHADGSTGRGGPLPPPTIAPAANHAHRLPATVRDTPPHVAARGGSTPRDGGRAASPAHGHRAPVSRLPGDRPTAGRLPADRPSQSVPPRDAGPHLPGARSPGDSPSPAILQPSRRSSGHVPAIRPPFSVPPPKPPTSRLRRPRRQSSPGMIFPPCGSHKRETTARGTRTAPLLFSAPPPLRGRSGRSAEIPEDRGRMLPASCRPLRTDSHAASAPPARPGSGRPLAPRVRRADRRKLGPPVSRTPTRWQPLPPAAPAVAS